MAANRLVLRPVPADRKLCANLRRQVRRRPAVALMLVTSIAVQGASHALLALCAGSLVRAVLSGQQPVTTKPWSEAWVALSPVSLTYFGLLAALVKTGSGALAAYCESTLTLSLGNALRLHIARATLDGGSKIRARRMLHRVTTRVREIELATRCGLLGGARAVAQIVPLAACWVWLSPALAAVCGTALFAFGLTLSRYRTRFRRQDARAQTLAERLGLAVDELLSNADLFRSYGAGGPVLASVAALGERSAAAEARVSAARAALSGANEVLVAAALVAGVWAASARWVSLDGAPLIEFASVFFLAYRPIRDLGDAREWIARGTVAQHALDLSIAREAPPARPAGAQDSPAHPPAPLVLEAFGARRLGPQVTAVIEPGALVCLRGPTGAGKTTLLRALLGLEPQCGALRYGARSLDDAEVGSRPFAWVPQSAPLVMAPLLPNVTLGRTSETAALNALKALGATDLLAVAGDSILGPAGRPVSGGERRLIALSRALATAKPVLLLDEPTEGLDAAATLRVLTALEKLRGLRTVIVSTHRDEVERICDRVIRIGAAVPEAAE